MLYFSVDGFQHIICTFSPKQKKALRPQADDQNEGFNDKIDSTGSAYIEGEDVPF